MKKILFIIPVLISSFAHAQHVSIRAAAIGYNYNIAYTIVSADDGPSQTVANGTSFASLNLPATATTRLSNGDVPSYAVTWSSAGYNGATGGDQVIFGDYTSLPSNITNPFLVRPAITITVQSLSTTVTVTTTGLGTWTVPAGVTSVFVQAISGGGTGGSLAQIGKASGGGGSAYAEGIVTVVSGSVIDYNVAASQLAPLPSGTDIDGLDGLTTYFGPVGSPYVRAEAGKGGPSNGLLDGKGGLAINCIGDLTRNGGYGTIPAASRSGGGGGAAGLTDVGANAINVSGTSVTGGIGNSPGGTGGNGSSGNGVTGSNYGSGGSGTRNTIVTNSRGGGSSQGWLQYTYTGSSTPPPAAGDAYVIHIAGQSNVISPGNGSPGSPYTGALNTKMWISSGTGFAALEYGVNNNSNSGSSTTALGPELGIANAIGALATNSTYITKKGQSGTSIYNQWNTDVNAVGRTSSTQLYTAVNYLQDQGKTIKGIWVVYRQGEADQGATNPWATVTYTYGTGVPSSGTGVTGGVYIDKTNNLLYGLKSQYGNTNWGSGFKFYTLSGSGTPASGASTIGSCYWDSTNDLYYFKTGASTWTSVNVQQAAVRAYYLYNTYKLINYHVDGLNSHSVPTNGAITFKWIDCLIDNPQTVDNTYVSSVNMAKTWAMANYTTDNSTYSTKVIAFSAISVSAQTTVDGVHLSTAGELAMGAAAGAVMSIP